MLGFRLAVGGAALLAGLVLAVIAAIEGRFLGGAGSIAAGIALAVTVVFWEQCMSPGFWLAPVCATALTYFSIGDVLTSSHAVNSNEIEAQNDFLNLIINSQGGLSPISLREKKLVEAAFKACALQGIQDQQDLIVGAQKAIYFGSALTLADGVNSALTSEHPVRCLDYYRELRKTQPQLFVRFERNHPWLLAE
ncbi:hypothetical protein PUP75_11340 [Pseudomonas chlororaphis]|uniref:hypothetical protein n=1 Tax=Pseudomonas chlororaphis TaxID=587753 RepID=UPI002368A016|nr:hypothetical protein [Pseudomonas chlororaphis]WDH55350.1 hypothetical protein PUP75_11340 [Pseudomonas chlororaphis]